MKVIKTYYPRVKTIEVFMFLVYVIVVLFGTALLWVKGDLSVERWQTFIMIGFIYIAFCVLLSVCIRTQRIELTENGMHHKLLGLNRRVVAFSSVKRVTFGKVNGSLVIAIEKHFDRKTTYVPYIPFEQDWDEIVSYIKQKNKKAIIAI
ncbi:hypothetical protein [Alkalihalobacillus sp. CinArs1]|uniref:hypothetical protein n=1 Tax=Alkalihalobacillus sp. CinArs1 TaxID=2995314 RepID=UPI0022DD5AA6|nr:hypothetical protein [Alkalihalobacillus sp. CinArs1]